MIQNFRLFQLSKNLYIRLKRFEFQELFMIGTLFILAN